MLVLGGPLRLKVPVLPETVTGDGRGSGWKGKPSSLGLDGWKPFVLYRLFEAKRIDNKVIYCMTSIKINADCKNSKECLITKTFHEEVNIYSL